MLAFLAMRTIARRFFRPKEAGAACGMNQDLVAKIAAPQRTLNEGWVRPTTI